MTVAVSLPPATHPGGRAYKEGVITSTLPGGESGAGWSVTWKAQSWDLNSGPGLKTVGSVCCVSLTASLLINVSC